MMPDLFSIFDPSNNSLHPQYPLTYTLLSLASIMFLNISLWPNTSSLATLKGASMMVGLNQANQTTALHLKMMPSLIASLFIILASVNLSTLIPYSPNPTSHLALTLPLGLPMWLTLILSSLRRFMKFAAAFLPSGTPEWLTSPLVLIESASVFFRPVTLCFRLAANMTAGHIIFSLLATCSTPTLHLPTSIPALLLITTLAGYCVFEMGICVIQAYIFCLLLTLYSNEHPTPY